MRKTRVTIVLKSVSKREVIEDAIRGDKKINTIHETIKIDDVLSVSTSDEERYLIVTGDGADINRDWWIPTANIHYIIEEEYEDKETN
jgi:hypothetical protein